MGAEIVSAELEGKIKRLEAIASAAGNVLPQILAVLLPGPGTAVSLIASGLMGYIKNRHEKNIEQMLQEMENRISYLEKILEEYTTEEVRILKEDIFPLVCDYSANEIQKEKIKLFVNGFQYAVEERLLKQEIFLEYMDALNALRLKDITVFNMLVDKKMDTDSTTLERFRVDKLVLSGLVYVKATFGSLEGQDYTLEQVCVTDFGNKFFYFIQREYRTKI